MQRPLAPASAWPRFPVAVARRADAQRRPRPRAGKRCGGEASGGMRCELTGMHANGPRVNLRGAPTCARRCSSRPIKDGSCNRY